MALMKRIFLFMLVNILVMVSVSIITGIVSTFLYGTPTPPNGSIIGIVIWSGVWGMGGAFISLLLSKFMAKRMMGVKIIDPKTMDSQSRRIVEAVHHLARKARLKKMPEVGVYDNPEMNAFATGPSKSNSLVAVSSGLLNALDDEQLEGVLAHEIAHIANGDMVTLTLIQGVINAFVLFFARIVASIIASNFDRGRGFIEFGVYIALQIAFSLLGSMVVAYFSRIREFRADSGGAKYAGRGKMISALQALSRQTVPYNKKDNLAALKISGASSMSMLLRTHPPLQDRIARLQKGY